MSAMIGGGYGENRGSSNTSLFYDQPTNEAREHDVKLWQNPELIPGFYTGQGEGVGSFTPPDLDQTNSIIGDLRGMGTGLTPTEQSGINEFRKSTDLKSLQDAERENFGHIVTPQIRNQLASIGMGRSGATTEAIANAGVQSSVPLAQLANQRQAELGQLLGGMGAGAAERFLRALLGGGNLALQGALGSSGQANQFNLGKLGQRNQLFQALLNFLQPLEVREKGKTKGSQWNVKGSVGYGAAGM